jgi:hypothetical protein
MEIADVMDRIKAGQQNTPPTEFGLISHEIAGICDDSARDVEFKLYRDKRALQVDPAVAYWISFAGNAALCAHTYILEDGRKLPKVLGRHAD